MRTYARKVRSDARWSRATEPVFRKVSESLNGTFGFGVPAATTAETEILSAFGWEEEEGAAADASTAQLGFKLGWPASALARDWECVSLTSSSTSSSSSSSSEFGRVPRDTRMGDGWGARRPDLVSSEGIVDGCILYCMRMKTELDGFRSHIRSSVRFYCTRLGLRVRN